MSKPVTQKDILIWIITIVACLAVYWGYQDGRKDKHDQKLKNKTEMVHDNEQSKN